MNIGSPTVIVPQLRREINDTTVFGEEMASWLYSVFGFAALPWVVIMPIFIRFFGCKITFIVIGVDILITYIIFCTSTNPLQILISEIVFGLAYAGNLIIGIYVISEYTSPKYRGMFLTIKSASLFWGVWCSNAIGTFLHWKYIGIVGGVCCIYLFGCFFWIESPYRLAVKGRFEDCKRSHRWLFGSNVEAERNLEKLLLSAQGTKKEKWTFDKMLATVSAREFLMPVLLSFVLLAQYNLTVSSSFCTLILFLFLPETKDRSLQEIEELFKKK
ncbi:unnamed protein product [Colias eurytheme]|nr:unnamed protein product [Colias eurytheme]